MSTQPFISIDQMVLGLHITCIYRHHSREGQSAVIIGNVTTNRYLSGSFTVKWDNDGKEGTWSSPQFFTPIDPDYAEKLADQERRKQHAMKYL